MACINDRWKVPFGAIGLAFISLTLASALVANCTPGWIQWSEPVVTNISFLLKNLYSFKLSITFDTSSVQVGLWKTCSQTSNGATCISTTDISENNQSCASTFIHATNAGRALFVCGIVLACFCMLLSAAVLRYRSKKALSWGSIILAGLSSACFLGALVTVRVVWEGKQICGDWFKPRSANWGYSCWFGIASVVFAFLSFVMLAIAHRIPYVKRDPYGAVIGSQGSNSSGGHRGMNTNEAVTHIVVGIPVEEIQGSTPPTKQESII